MFTTSPIINRVTIGAMGDNFFGRGGSGGFVGGFFSLIIKGELVEFFSVENGTLDLKMTNFVVASRFKNQHSGRCPIFCHPKMSNFPSGCSKTTKWVTESTNGDPISTKWVPPKIQNGVRQLYGSLNGKKGLKNHYLYSH